MRDSIKYVGEVLGGYEKGGWYEGGEDKKGTRGPGAFAKLSALD